MSRVKWDAKAPIVPVHPTTNSLLSYPTHDAIWSREYDFEAAMKVTDWARGMSSVTFILSEVGGVNDERTYPIFVSEFYWVIRNRNIIDGVIERTWWTFAKQGQNYSIKLR